MIDQLLSRIGEYGKDSVKAAAFVVMQAVMEAVIPFLMARLIDYGINPGRMDAVWNYGILLLAAAVGALVFGIIAANFAAHAAAGFAKNLRRGMYYSIQDFSFANIDKFSTASLITRLTTDVTNVQNAYQMIISMAVQSPVMMLFSLAMAFSINPRLSLIFLAAIPFLGIGFYLIISHVHPLFVRVLKIYDKLNDIVREDLRGIRVVKTFVRQDYEEKKFNSTSKKVRDNFLKAEKLIILNNPLMQFSIYGCILALSWFGARMIVSSTMTTGQLLGIIAYNSQILISLMILSMVSVMILISRSSAERISQVLSEKSDIKNPADPILELINGSVSFRDVDFSYSGSPDSLSLKDVNLEIESGQTIGIIGGTGSSKTTLVQLIPRLYDAIGGTVLVGGRDVREYDLNVLRGGVAMVLQKNILFSGTIKENLRWGNKDASDEEIIHACKLAQADDFIRSFPDGYDTYIEQGGVNLSGGQKQRLCIARALVKKPKIIILDDSTSAVDTKTDALIRKTFGRYIPDVTKLIITQRVASVMDADKIIVMENGRVNGFGNHNDLLKTNTIYRQVCQLQLENKDMTL